MIAPSALILLSVGVVFSCDLSDVPEASRSLAEKVCQLEKEMKVMESVLQELLQRIDITVLPDASDISAAPEKRKNEFIRFGKRSSDGEVEKRKNEFIRFGKRKNEFIRFGRSLPMENEMIKRKNEFIRFG